VLKLDKSRILFEKAKKITPGGVHDELRFMQPNPIFFKRAKGSRIFDVDGNEYIDFHMAFGPVILGHCNTKVVAAVKRQAETGDLWGTGAYEQECELSEKISKYVPSAEMVRICNAGSDGTYHAIRLARAYTKKEKILKFEGGYHGWHDYVAISVTPPADKVGMIYAQSDGIPANTLQNTLFFDISYDKQVDITRFRLISTCERTVNKRKLDSLYL